jgi:hypothetical protein
MGTWLVFHDYKGLGALIPLKWHSNFVLIFSDVAVLHVLELHPTL